MSEITDETRVKKDSSEYQGDTDKVREGETTGETCLEADVLNYLGKWPQPFSQGLRLHYIGKRNFRLLLLKTFIELVPQGYFCGCQGV